VAHRRPHPPAQVAGDAKPGRFNGNGVDLNRNWDCRWSPTGLWGTTEVSGGSAAMSEPETQGLAAFLTQPPMDAVVFWHSAVPGVFAGGCDGPDRGFLGLLGSWRRLQHLLWKTRHELKMGLFMHSRGCS